MSGRTNWIYLAKDGMTPVMDKINKGFDRMKQKTKGFESSFSRAKSNIGKSFKDFKGQAMGAIGDISDEIPVLGRGLRLAANPWVAAGAGIAGLAMAANSAMQVAGDFNNVFLEIEDLNLDKPKNELMGYRKQILNTAAANGFAADQTARAFFDVQSALGIYGDDVDKVVTKVGKFAVSTKQDFNTSIGATVKAMRTFNLTADQLDGYLASNFATVQVGVTTYDELAKVQTEYGLAAVKAGQNFNTANKVFSAFTAVSKDTNIAATLTKTAFEGLSDPKILKGLQKQKIAVFDAKGQFLSTEQIIRNMLPKLQKMNDMEFSSFMGELGGPEGFKNLMSNIKGNGDELLKTFEAFDKAAAGADFGKMAENARGDFNTLKTILKNQLNTYMIMLGEKLLPTVIKGLQWLSDTAEWIRTTWIKLNSETELFGDILSGAWSIVKGMLFPFIKIWDTIKSILKPTGTFRALLEGVGIDVDNIGGRFMDLFYTMNEWWVTGKVIFTAFGELARRTGKIIWDAMTFDFTAAEEGFKSLKEQASNFSVSEIVQSRLKGKKGKDVTSGSAMPEGGGPGAGSGAGAGQSPGNFVSGDMGEGKSVRNMVINIQKLTGIENYISSGAGVDPSVLERIVSEMMIRAIRDTEAATSNG